MDIIGEITNGLIEQYFMKVENYIKLHIRPKPKWLPYFIWKKILRRLLIIEMIK